MKRIKFLVVALAAVVLASISGPAASASNQAPTIDPKVMTQNLYIGVDLDRILQGESPAAVFETALASDFPGRATAFAGQVASEQPDLVGLQEVTNITVFNAEGQTLNTIDYLQIVMGNLDAIGLDYAVSSVVINADVTLPIDLEAGIFARVVDRDVIIHNAATTTVSNPTSDNFSDNFAVELGGTPIKFTRGYTAVDATVDENKFRFVNTHLEVENAPCATPSGVIICQNSQAEELVAALAEESLPTILVGDFNAAQGETAYQSLTAAGYLDTWNGGPGFTCCQTELLNNTDSELAKRIDLVFYRKQGVSEVTASTSTLNAKSASGLWYSDHAGVVASFELGICDVVVPTIEATSGSHLLRGTDGDDIIFGYDGNETIFSRDGNDIICAGNGTNVIVGGSDSDIIIAGSGRDTIYTIGGDNIVVAGDGRNFIIGGSGNDTITTGSGKDTILSGYGDDIVSSGAGDDFVYVSVGNDTVDGGSGYDTCYSEEISSNCER